ncbi:MAG: VOC family protein [Iodobacter sp.]
MSAIPNEYQTATPYLIVNDAPRAIAFYKEAFRATEIIRLTDPSGKIAHAEIRIGHAPIMLADEQMGYRSPASLGGSPVSLLLYVEDADTLFAQAIASGAEELSPVSDQFYGDRMGSLKDPFGHIWSLATRVEEVPDQEVQKRFAAMFKS